MKKVLLNIGNLLSEIPLPHEWLGLFGGLLMRFIFPYRKPKPDAPIYPDD